jgi:hypothetical protein
MPADYISAYCWQRFPIEWLEFVRRRSGWMPYCLIQECSRAGRALPHQNAPDPTSVCQSITRVLLCRPSRRDPNRLSCSIGEPPFPSRPGAAQATARNGGDWEERSHPQPRTARSCARAWRGWRAPDLPRSEHRGTLPPVEDRASAHPLRSVTSRNRRHAYGVRGVERCLPRHLSRGCHPKHHFMRQRMPPVLQPTLQRPQLPIRVDTGLLCLQPLK